MYLIICNNGSVFVCEQETQGAAEFEFLSSGRSAKEINRIVKFR